MSNELTTEKAISDHFLCIVVTKVCVSMSLYTSLYVQSFKRNPIVRRPFSWLYVIYLYSVIYNVY
jgi:hypothetical protein